jgi:UDP-N-acetyl-D-glucosamine dehydrogenase
MTDLKAEFGMSESGTEITKCGVGVSPSLASIGVVGLGYVGLPTALELHRAGFSVIGIDVDDQRLSAIRAGVIDSTSASPADLRTIVLSGDFALTAESDHMGDVDVVIICVPTPIDGAMAPDATALKQACTDVVANARRGQTIILTSTTFVGCTRSYLAGPLEDRGFRIGEDVFLAFCPERINPGNGTTGLDQVPRVVGGVTPACTDAAASVVGHITPSVFPVSSPEAAEMAKLVENTFRAVNIALANEFADAASLLGIDTTEVLDAAASKPYGFMPFNPGAGVGGHCIPCDPHYLLWQLRSRRVQSPVIDQAMAALASRPLKVADRAIDLLGQNLRPVRGSRIALVGLAYKSGVEDVRESPALMLAALLRRRGAIVTAHDPLVSRLVQDHDGDVIRNGEPPHPDEIDMAIALTLHPGFDYDWLGNMPLVLDTTYRLDAGPQVVRL